MKVKFTVEFEVENDWDVPTFAYDNGAGRKQVVGSHIRRDTMVAIATSTTRTMRESGVVIHGMAVSEPEWIGWDNEAIARQLVEEEAADELVIADVEATTETVPAITD